VHEFCFCPPSLLSPQIPQKVRHPAKGPEFSYPLRHIVPPLPFSPSWCFLGFIFSHHFFLSAPPLSPSSLRGSHNPTVSLLVVFDCHFYCATEPIPCRARFPCPHVRRQKAVRFLRCVPELVFFLNFPLHPPFPLLSFSLSEGEFFFPISLLGVSSFRFFTSRCVFLRALSTDSFRLFFFAFCIVPAEFSLRT